MRSLGQLQTGTGSLTADYPAAMAFKTTLGVINYVVYNYQNSDINVTFSDGTVVNAPSNSFSIKSQ